MRFRFFAAVLVSAFWPGFSAFTVDAQSGSARRFNIEKDLLLAHYDCKTDVDDLHSVAAFFTILSDPAFSKLNYHAVAGTYGIQEGLYVPPNELFQLAFGKHWSDAHADFDSALNEVFEKADAALSKGGDIWIAEAGQSDFSASLLKRLANEKPGIDLKKRIHLVQHSRWNEEVTAPEALAFVKERADYIKIDDGNAEGNGTPGFRSAEFKGWKNYLTGKKLIEIWQLAVEFGNRYNGKDGRYNNEAVAAGGLDFSDTVEICRILGIENIGNAKDFFERFGR